MRKQIPQENSARVLGLALAAWAAVVAAAAVRGVFATLSTAEIAGVALFATLYATATFLLDATLRAFIVRAAARFIAPAAIAADIAIGLALAAVAGGNGPWQASLGHPANAFVLLFVVPLAAVLHLAWLGRGARKSPARSPGGSPVST